MATNTASTFCALFADVSMKSSPFSSAYADASYTQTNDQVFIHTQMTRQTHLKVHGTLALGVAACAQVRLVSGKRNHNVRARLALLGRGQPKNSMDHSQSNVKTMHD